MLSDKQERFAQAYILHRNATEAAKAAGYAPRSAYNQGYRMLKNDEIVFVGDAPTDYWGAEEAKIGFIARIIPGEYNPFGTGEFKIKHIIGDLTSLDKTLNTIVNWVF